MTEFEKLVVHLKNLHQKKVKSATFDVNWLLAALQIEVPKPVVKQQPVKNNSPQKIEVDGGSFRE